MFRKEKMAEPALWFNNGIFCFFEFDITEKPRGDAKIVGKKIFGI